MTEEFWLSCRFLITLQEQIEWIWGITKLQSHSISQTPAALNSTLWPRAEVKGPYERWGTQEERMRTERQTIPDTEQGTWQWGPEDKTGMSNALARQEPSDQEDWGSPTCKGNLAVSLGAGGWFVAWFHSRALTLSGNLKDLAKKANTKVRRKSLQCNCSSAHLHGNVQGDMVAIKGKRNVQQTGSKTCHQKKNVTTYNVTIFSTWH